MEDCNGKPKQHPDIFSKFSFIEFPSSFVEKFPIGIEFVPTFVESSSAFVEFSSPFVEFSRTAFASGFLALCIKYRRWR